MSSVKYSNTEMYKAESHVIYTALRLFYAL